jgi:metal-responsive CopG/Arc/MetJ family transcriptional regulator
METSRTTIVLGSALYRKAKLAAARQDRSLKEIVEEALRAYLREREAQVRESRSLRFGVYPGRPRGSLRRESLYRKLGK